MATDTDTATDTGTGTGLQREKQQVRHGEAHVASRVHINTHTHTHTHTRTHRRGEESAEEHTSVTRVLKEVSDGSRCDTCSNSSSLSAPVLSLIANVVPGAWVQVRAVRYAQQHRRRSHSCNSENGGDDTGCVGMHKGMRMERAAGERARR